MGNSASSPEQPDAEASAKHISSVAKGCINKFDLYALNNHKLSDEHIEEILHLHNAPGSYLFMRSVRFLAAYPTVNFVDVSIVENLPKVLCFYDQTLVQAMKMSTDQWHKLLFISLASSALVTHDTNELSIETFFNSVDQLFIDFSEFLDLCTLLFCALEQSPSKAVMNMTPSPQDRKIAVSLLDPIKAPIIKLPAFMDLVHEYPRLLSSFKIILDQVLYPEPLTPDSQDIIDPNPAPRLKRASLCPLYLCLGPQVEKLVPLYSGAEHGFSLRSFQGKVFFWNAPTILIVRGVRQSSPISEFDEAFPPLRGLCDVHISKKVEFAVYVPDAWKSSKKKGFAGIETKIIHIKPSLTTYIVRGDADHEAIGYFSPKYGIGFGIKPSQHDSYGPQMRGGISLLIDSYLEYGIFRSLGDAGSFTPRFGRQTQFEERFTISEIEVWGCGTDADLEHQRRAWEVEENDAKRRQSVNVNEDRAILELAGLVGPKRNS